MLHAPNPVIVHVFSPAILSLPFSSSPTAVWRHTRHNFTVVRCFRCCLSTYNLRFMRARRCYCRRWILLLNYGRVRTSERCATDARFTALSESANLRCALKAFLLRSLNTLFINKSNVAGEGCSRFYYWYYYYSGYLRPEKTYTLIIAPL